jgi:hypothetical protein
MFVVYPECFPAFLVGVGFCSFGLFVSVFVRFSVNKLDILFFLINILGQSFLPPFQKKSTFFSINVYVSPG